MDMDLGGATKKRRDWVSVAEKKRSEEKLTLAPESKETVIDLLEPHVNRVATLSTVYINLQNTRGVNPDILLDASAGP